MLSYKLNKLFPFRRLLWQLRMLSSTVQGQQTSLALVYSKFGQPENVVSLEERKRVDPASNEVEVEMMLSPVNPSDINQIQGTYPLRPQLPAIAGNEGVGVVSKVGKAVTSLKEGEWVIPASPGLGTWTTHIVDSADKFFKVPSYLDPQVAASLIVNPPTAYRMLKDFVHLNKGDTVIQNGSNSAVGQCVIQLAAAWGVNTINVVRDRPDLDKLKVFLKDLGATEVITEEGLASREMIKLLTKYQPPRLGLNCVGGKSATNIVRYLSSQGVLVTYGGMSREPVIIPTGPLIFKEMTCVGYWQTMWLQRNLNSKAHQDMMDDLYALSQSGSLRAPRGTEYNLTEYKSVLATAMKPFNTIKQMLVMNK